MASFPSRSDGPRLALPTGVEISSYSTYLEAQRAVDHLSDEDFPVQRISIVGTDLRMVEKVLGRLTYGRVALSGAMSGAWFGLLIGLLFMIMAPNQPGILLAGPLMGAAFGILAGVVGFALRSRDRDFTSTSQVVASRYAIIAENEIAGQARRELEHAGFAAHASPGAQPIAPEPMRSGVHAPGPDAEAAQGGPRGPYGGTSGPAGQAGDGRATPGEARWGHPGPRYDGYGPTGAQGAPGRDPWAPPHREEVPGGPQRRGAPEAGPQQHGAPEPREDPRQVPPAAQPPQYGIRLEPGQRIEDFTGPRRTERRGDGSGDDERRDEQ